MDVVEQIETGFDRKLWFGNVIDFRGLETRHGSVMEVLDLEVPLSLARYHGDAEGDKDESVGDKDFILDVGADNVQPREVDL